MKPPPLIDLRRLEEEAKRYERAGERWKTAIDRFCELPEGTGDARQIHCRSELHDKAAHRFARMTARWLKATRPMWEPPGEQEEVMCKTCRSDKDNGP